MNKHRNKNKRKELLELFDLATVNPKLAKKLIEPQIIQPYTRALASDIERKNIINLSDYHVQNYYQDLLYKLWNYAKKEEREQ